MKDPRVSAIAFLSGFKTWMTRREQRAEPDSATLDATEKRRSCGRSVTPQHSRMPDGRCTGQIDRWPPGPSLDNYS